LFLRKDNMGVNSMPLMSTNEMFNMWNAMMLGGCQGVAIRLLWSC